ncbi:twin arginine translocase protein A [Planctomycetes bacterium CA13]|uniref:Sec-independent protein translocase protein TatA n=1 Tax=Novipirellula herctigrandis TaxID=2527986 RepID=A0A5C5YN33_9BACT|nr:twin arginine translocase protein A [Planctomycetes bacterium CA13]
MLSMFVENSVLAFGFPGMPEMVIVLFIALLLFGGAKLPSLMRNLGKSANEFKRGMNESVDDEETSEREES